MIELKFPESGEFPLYKTVSYPSIQSWELFKVQ